MVIADMSMDISNLKSVLEKMSALTSMASLNVSNGSLRDKIHENRSSSRQGRRELKS